MVTYRARLKNPLTRVNNFFLTLVPENKQNNKETLNNPMKALLFTSIIGFCGIALAVHYDSLLWLAILCVINPLYLLVLLLKMPSPGTTLETLFKWCLFFCILLIIATRYEFKPLVQSASIGIILTVSLMLLQPLPKRFRKDRHNRTTIDQL